tara:strand:+ start:247 stop:657 length:411 start_codon:yes stop_codon:yes gene_type:complete
VTTFSPSKKKQKRRKRRRIGHISRTPRTATTTTLPFFFFPRANDEEEEEEDAWWWWWYRWYRWRAAAAGLFAVFVAVAFFSIPVDIVIISFFGGMEWIPTPTAREEEHVFATAERVDGKTERENRTEKTRGKGVLF